MSRMSPTAYDSWWRARIAKEGTDQANHVLKNWQLDIEGGKRMNPITQELTLNSIGTPQFTLKQRPIVQPGMAGLLADRQVLGSSSNGKQPSLSPHQPRGSTVAGPTAVASVAVHTRSRPNSRANSLVTTAVSGHANPAKLKPAIAAVTLQAAPADDTKSNVSRGSCSNVSRSSRGTIPAAARSTVSSVARTNVSYPRTPQFSSVGSSSVANSEVMSRLARLEADLAQEKMKRQAAEAEMRHIMASRGVCCQ